MKLHTSDLPDYLDLLTSAGAPIYLESRPGSGKSKSIEAWARAKNNEEPYCFLEINCATDNIADIRGYLMPHEEKHIGVDGVERAYLMGRYTYPYWARDKFSGKPAFMFKSGVIVIEEYGQGGLEEKKALAPLIQDRRMGEFCFEGFDVIILSNRPQDGAGVTRDLTHIINRRVDAELVTGIEGTLVVGHERGWTPITLAFVARNEDILFVNDVPKQQGPFLTNRSLELMDRIVQQADADGRSLDDPLVLIAAAGCIGEGPAHRYMAFAKARSKIPTVSKIVADPVGTDVPSELDVMMFLVFDLAAKTTRGNIDQICIYVKRLPSDMAVTYFNAACRRDKSLVSTAAFSAFARDNLSVLQAVAARK